MNFIICIKFIAQASIAYVADTLEQQHDQIAGKLSNEGFVSKAPPAVVEGEKVKLAEFADQLAKIKANMEQIANL